jgi:hypothetical protein
MNKMWTWITQAFKKKSTSPKEDIGEEAKIKATLATMPIERNTMRAIERVNISGLTDKQKWMYNYVSSCGDRFVSPTEVAEQYGLTFKGNKLASNFSSPVLTFLVNEGLLEKNKKGHYKIK